MTKQINVTFEGADVFFNGIYVGEVSHAPAIRFRSEYYYFSWARECKTGDQQQPRLRDGIYHQLSASLPHAARDNEKVCAHIVKHAQMLARRIHPQLRELGGF